MFEITFISSHEQYQNTKVYILVWDGYKEWKFSKCTTNIQYPSLEPYGQIHKILTDVITCETCDLVISMVYHIAYNEHHLDETVAAKVSARD